MKFAAGDHVQIMDKSYIVPKWRNAIGTIVAYIGMPDIYEFSPDDKCLSTTNVIVSEENIILLNTNHPIDVEGLI